MSSVRPLNYRGISTPFCDVVCAFGVLAMVPRQETRIGEESKSVTLTMECSRRPPGRGKTNGVLSSVNALFLDEVLRTSSRKRAFSSIMSILTAWSVDMIESMVGLTLNRLACNGALKGTRSVVGHRGLLWFWMGLEPTNVGQLQILRVGSVAQFAPRYIYVLLMHSYRSCKTATGDGQGRE